jgi:3-oxoacyl-[acyl-carrier-protein] synthase-3
VLTNADLEKMMDTSDEWIVQRTGVRERRIVDPSKGEGTTSLSTEALTKALADARVDAKDLDLVIVASVTAEMTCPSVACRIAAAVGAGTAAAFDLVAACSGFVYGMNIAHDLIKAGAYNTIAVVGCDTLSQNMEYSDHGRSVCIIFGDAAGAAILKATDDSKLGIIAQSMHADGSGADELYFPRSPRDIPLPIRERGEADDIVMNTLQMNGRSVFRFAVGTFPQLIQETLDKAGLTAEEVDQFICHQSNVRILEASRERFGLPPEKLYVNIDRIGNSSAGSVPLCLDELRRAGMVREGSRFMLVAFGGGLTWASSLWQL